MAEKCGHKVGFKRIEIFREDELGTGAYGQVYKAKCDDLVCAAKLLHPILTKYDQILSPGEATSQTYPRQRFEREFELLSATRHPNIVQYLGLHHDLSSDSPVLLMELMDSSLTHFLENSPNPIPYHVQVNICHDIALALSYLHSNNIIHRDLSSNNVLLTSNLQAKLSDFGMARLTTTNLRAVFTQCPGANVYMPPEAVQDHPVYTEKLDCFSFGVIVVQTVTKLFPQPACERYLTVHGQCGSTTVRVVPEIERRHNHISQIDQSHRLLPIALDCLHDVEAQRPSAHILCERLELLKGTSDYSDSVSVLSSDQVAEQCQVDEVLLRYMRRSRTLLNQLQVKDRAVSHIQQVNDELREQLSQSGQEITQLQQRNALLEEEVQSLCQQTEQSRRQIGREIQVRQGLKKQLNVTQHNLKEQIKVNKHELESQRQTYVQKIRGLQRIISRQRESITCRDREIDHLKQQVMLLDRQRSREESISDIVKNEVERQISKRLCQTSLDRHSVRTLSVTSEREEETIPHQDITFHLEWSSDRKKAPCGMAAHCNTVRCGDIVYFQPTDTNSLYAYNTTTDVWEHLPDCKKSNSSMAVVNDLVTTIGGSKLITGHSRKLYSLTGKGKVMKWMRIFPDMPTKRSESSALSTRMALIVAGGEGKSGKALTTVEVMNTDTLQWSRASDLPEPLWGSSPALCGSQLYIVGGVSVSRPSKSVYTCSIMALLQSCQPAFTGVDVSSPIEVWNQISDIPITGPTCVSFHGRLMLVGGEEQNNTRTAAIHMYNGNTGSWTVISEMSKGRNQCFATVVSDDRLMVVGGWIDTIQDQTASNAVDFATIDILCPLQDNKC